MSQVLRIGLIAIMLAAQGCAITADPSSPQINNLVIAEPLLSNYENERKVDRYTHLLFSKELTKEQRAQLFYERGVLYDGLGLRGLAFADFSRALKIKPDFVDAYNFIGIHYTQLQQFSQAYDSFDSAIELLPKHQYAYLNRGIALYYGNRARLALNDFSAFYQMEQQDPYRVLWLYLAEYQQAPQAAKQALYQRSEQIADNLWAKQIIALYLGQLSQQEFLQRLPVGADSKQALSERLCEAYFYLGKYNQQLGYQERAANFFKLALSTNVYEFVEHRYAQLELDML